MTEEEFKALTRALGVGCIRLVEGFPSSIPSSVIARQLVRCSTSVGANYRAACRAKSTNDMIAKLAIVEEEADETVYWLEMTAELAYGEPELREIANPSSRLNR